MATVAFRIPDDMKKRMEHLDMNWSEYIREAINDALQSHQKRNLIKKIQKISNGKKRVKALTALDIIREMRNHD